MLNHSDELGLPQLHVSGALANRLYGIEAAPVSTAFEAAGLVLVSAADTVYANENPIADGAGEIRGAVVSDDLVVIGTNREVILTTTDAMVVERSAIAPSQELNRVGLEGSRVVVDTDTGLFALDTNQMQLTALDSLSIDPAWSVPVQLDAAQGRRVSDAAAGHIITWERLLSDLHSGRILPVFGRYLFDITALCLLYLCISGVFLWFRRR